MSNHFKIVKRGGEGYGMNHKEFILEDASAVSALPNSQTPAPDTAEAGSIAYTGDLEHIFILGPSDEWEGA